MAKLTNIGTDYIYINESVLNDSALMDKLHALPRIHIIEFAFTDPTKEKIEKVLQIFDKTNRFVISNDIRIYNNVLKTTAKKYYVVNKKESPLISFFRKNNKVLLNLNNVSEEDKKFLLGAVFMDVLKNIEVIRLSKTDYEKVKVILDCWEGNVIVD